MRKYILPMLLTLTFLSSPSHVLGADIVEAAATSGGVKTFVAALKSAGLAAEMKNSGPYTVFAPDDAAFEKLPPSTREALMKDKTKLAKVLEYHVIPGKVLVADVKPGKTQTLQGSAITLHSDNGLVKVDGASVTQSDVTADNGVIHVIDSVLLPKE